jgi:two-component system cell cycle sensor histidine kinase/response regulator CckA
VDPLANVARERARILAPAVFIGLAAYVAAFRALGIAPPLTVHLFDVGVLLVLGVLSYAIVARRIPMQWAHGASAAVLWCPLVVTLVSFGATHLPVYTTLLVMQVACAGVLLGTRWLVATLVLVAAIATLLLVQISAPYAGVRISCIASASVMALLIHVLMRRAMVNALRSEDSFRALVETSPDAMYVHGDAADGFTIRWVNPAMLTLLGYDAAGELIGKRSVETFVHVDERARVVEHRERVHRGEAVSGMEVLWVRRDGATRQVSVRSRRVMFAGGSAWLVVARDRTAQAELERERAAAEAAIRKSEERHRLLFDGSPLPISVFDAETFQIVAVNQKMLELYGFSRDEMLAMTVKDLKPAEDHASLDAAMTATVVGGSHRPGIVRHRRKDGSIIEVDITAHHLEIDGRRCVLASGVDVTSSRRVEEQLRHAQRMDAIGQLAGGVAHDFNNILAVILSNASLVAEELGEAHPLRPEILDIEAATTKAAGLTRQLLAFSRKQPRRVTEIALNSTITNLEKMLSRIVGEDIEMVASLSPQLGSVLGDVGQLEQVLMNLVVNARDAMPSGGRLLVETSNVELDERQAAEVGARAGRHVMLAVTDTGCGMTCETRARIFEPFFTTKPVGKGTGLGLATVFGIVKQADGGIAVQTELGRGTKFRIYLPRIDAVTTEHPIPEAREVPLRGTETILVVEDDRLLRAVVRRQLQAFGYRILEARDPADALEVAAAFREPIDLLLTDLVMPGMDGRMLASKLLETRPTTKVLYMSGYSEHAAVKSAAIDPNDRLIEKPFTAITLSHAVRETLERGTKTASASSSPTSRRRVPRTLAPDDLTSN